MELVTRLQFYDYPTCTKRYLKRIYMVKNWLKVNNWFMGYTINVIMRLFTGHEQNV